MSTPSWESVEKQVQEWARILEPAGWLGLDRISASARGLLYLLAVHRWRGDIVQLCEALPHMPGELTPHDLLSTMIHLGYQVRSAEARLHRLDVRLCPALFVANNGRILLLLPPEKEDAPYRLFDPETGEMEVHTWRRRLRGMLYRFVPMTRELMQQERIVRNVDPRPLKWFRTLVRRFDPIFVQAFFVSLLINVLALASSLFVMMVYDKVIGTRSVETLRYFVFGALLAMALETTLRFLRARSLAFFGVRIDAITSAAVFERLLFLPPRLIEGSSIPAQIARIRDFDSIREFFSGPTGVTILELPFTLIFLLTIAIIGGPLALVPVVLACGYGVLVAVMLPRVQARTEAGASASVRRQAFLVETLQKIRAIKGHGLGAVWLKRFRELSGQCSLTGFSTAFLTSVIEALAYGLYVLAGVSTMAYGIHLVWQGRLTTGGLIASMMLVWRVLGPFQAVCNSLGRIRYIFRSVGQVHKLIRTPPEGGLVDRDPELCRIHGDVQFNGVGLRYTSDRGPVFAGFSLKVPRGSLVAVSGGSGTGKTSLLKITCGLYAPQMGAILIDGLDIRQRDPVELRKHIAYVPQIVQLFHGTIEKNLRMARPDASDDELYEALTWAGALEQVRALPEGLHTFIGDYRSEQLSSVLAFQLNMARGFLRDASIMLFDEMPSSVLHSPTGVLFEEYLEANRGRKTIFFATDKEELVRKADILIYLPGNGQVLAGKPDELLGALKAQGGR